MKTRFLSLLAVLGFAFTALAGGSFDLEDIRPILKDSKEWRQIEKTYDVEAIGDAVRLGRQWEELGGARCGPYELGATLKGTHHGMTHQIIIETRITFLKGEQVITKNLEKNATNFTETLVSIKVTPLPDPDKKAEKSPVAAKTAEATVRNYFAQVTDRKVQAAYDCFSADFKQRKSLKAYTTAFKETKDVELQSAVEAKMSAQASATVNVRMIVWDDKNQSSIWAGPIGLRLEADGWKIDDMSQLTQEKGR